MPVLLFTPGVLIERNNSAGGVGTADRVVFKCLNSASSVEVGRRVVLERTVLIDDTEITPAIAKAPRK
jgi:hypothetical protein